MAKLKLIFLLLLIFVFTWIYVPAIKSYSEISVEVSNNMPFPLEKSLQFSVELPGFKLSNNISISDGSIKLPVETIKAENSTVVLKTLLEFKASETKQLIIKYGDDVSNEYTNIFKPDFIGNYFIGYGSGNLYLISMAAQNSVKVSDPSGKLLFDKSLGFNETADINIGRDEVFVIKSERPIFAELSSLKSDFVSNSSDDMTSVYGSYFTLFVPREIFISAYKDTHIKLQSQKGTVIFEGDVPERGVYSNLSLSPGFYTVETSEPVTIQFGYSDDNIYTICYGGLSSFKGVSLGDILYSSLYPDTAITFKTKDKIYETENLTNPGDYLSKEVIKEFNDKITEYAPVYIKFSNPVLVYSDSNSGNVGGEQIPSVDGLGKDFVFRTGKIYNFNGVKHERKVVIVAGENNTSVSFNGKNLTLNSLESYNEDFTDSFTLVKIESDKPIAVFETGVDSGLEFFSVLLPIVDESSVSPVTVLKSSGNEPNQTELPALMNKIKEFFRKMGQGLISLKLYDGVKNAWKQILLLLMPISQTIKPYLSNYFPSLTLETLSTIIFCLILLIVVLVLIFVFKPKRKKAIPKVTIEEIKEKPVSFNVDTLEEKENFTVEEEKTRVLKLSEAEKLVTPQIEQEQLPTKEEEKQKPEEIKISEKQFGRRFARFRSKEAKVVTEKEQPEKTSEVAEVIQKPLEKIEEPLKENIIEQAKPAIEELKPIEASEGKVEQIPPVVEGEKIKEPEAAEISTEKEGKEAASSIEILLDKLKKEGKPKEEIEQVPEAPVPTPQVVKQVLKKTFEHSFVADAESLNKIFEAIDTDENTKKLLISKVFISATERERINFDVNDKYRVGVIALTPIELRIAEDIGKRINAKASTGEAILIARKIKALDVVVADVPVITNYQGVLISKIDDIV